MGLFDRLFGKKEALTNCDWCGTDFAGAAVESEGLTYCGEACLSAKNAPAKQPELRSVHGAKKMTLEDARGALGTAETELRHFHKVVTRSVEADLIVSSPTAEGDIQQREFEFWRSLDDIRAVLLEAGRDVSGYDAQRERSMVNSIEIRHSSDVSAGIGLRGPKIVQTKTVTADFADGNIDRMGQAIAALRQSLGPKSESE